MISLLQRMLVAASMLGLPAIVAAQDGPGGRREQDSRVEHLSALTEEESRLLDRCVDRALAWLATQQRPDGSFPSIDTGQPGVTGLCVLAFLARGHSPAEGRYGSKLDSAIAYIHACRQPNGLLARVPPTSDMTVYSATHTAMYNHGIGGLSLAESYGLTHTKDSEQLHADIDAAIQFVGEQQRRRKRVSLDRGGWRYAFSRPQEEIDSDLSVSSWQLMFLRSARNAGFTVSVSHIEEGLEYIHRCFDARRGTFMYGLIEPHRRTTRAMVGAGILSLSLGGEHDTRAARSAGDWLLSHPFETYNQTLWELERFHYSAFYCSLGMFQLGGKYWTQFFPNLFRTLADHQGPDGSWEKEKGADERFGNAYTTALCVLALSPQYQLLPILQR